MAVPTTLTSGEMLMPFEFKVEEWPRWPLNMSESREEWFWFERLDIDWWYWFSGQCTWAIYPIILGYWATLYFTQRWMEGRGAFRGLRGIIATYHLLMAAFSVYFALRLFTLYHEDLVTKDWIHRIICRRKPISARFASLIIFGFVARCIQTLDSVFLILQKKPVPFFQVYHHSLVLFVSAQTLEFGEPFLAAVATLNTLQHAITYPYFAARVLEIRVWRYYTKVILFVELLQMILGLAAGIYTLLVIRNGGYCIRHPWSIKLFNFVYSSIFILVAHMIYVHFTKTKPVKPKTH